MTPSTTREQKYFLYTAKIIGGSGENAWHSEINGIYAANISEAVEQALDRAEKMQGWVVAVIQDN